MKVPYEHHDHDWGGGRDQWGEYFCLKDCKACDLEIRGRKAGERFASCVAEEIEHNALVLLERDGWEEQCPREAAWFFTHPEYPGIMVKWTPGTFLVTALPREMW